jgi:hypothetical protein
MNDRGMEPSLVMYNALVTGGVTHDLWCYSVLMALLCKEGKLVEA